MKIIIKFEGSNEVFKKALNKEVNGFINQCLGKDNPSQGSSMVKEVLKREERRKLKRLTKINYNFLVESE